MKYVAAVIILLILVAAAILLSLNPPTTDSLQIQMSSDPFPLAVGPSRLLITVTDGEGKPVADAVVTATGQMMHAGMPALSRSASRSEGGLYAVPMMWPMPGEWTVTVTAGLPARGLTAQEQFDLYVYGMYASNHNSRSSYKSQSEYAAALDSRQESELWIVIPQGAQALIRAGQADEIIPSEIRLNVSSKNVLVIQNDDIADHNVGPFYVRAGETIRQQFTLPAVYQGACSLNYNAEVSIIVDG